MREPKPCSKQEVDLNSDILTLEIDLWSHQEMLPKEGPFTIFRAARANHCFDIWEQTSNLISYWNGLVFFSVPVGIESLLLFMTRLCEFLECTSNPL
jgi:hypothetical protein